MLFSAPLAVVAAAVVVSASPVAPRADPITVPLKRLSTVTDIRNLVTKGQSRFRKDAASGTVINEDVSYIAEVQIGSGTYDLIVDTGSSNTWCGAQGACEPDSTGKATGGTVSVSYGSGSFSGKEYTDKVTFAGLTVPSQSIGAATRSSGFSGVDGIIGFGPVDLTEGTVSNANTVPTFMDNLLKDGLISTEVLGVSFRPESGGDSDDANGELTLGGTDASKYSGSITYVPTLTSGEASFYWGVKAAKLAYGSSSLATAVSGIVDTGTTLIYIPQAAYTKFLSDSGGKTDSSTGLASWTTAPTQNFVFTFGSTTFPLTPAQYLIPQAQYSFYGLPSGKSYSWIGNGGTEAPALIVGQKFIENYYTVFDTTNARVGFATGV